MGSMKALMARFRGSPSGTEPKVKFYMFAFDPPGQSTDLQAAKSAQAERLAAVEGDLRAFSGV